MRSALVAILCDSTHVCSCAAHCCPIGSTIRSLPRDGAMLPVAVRSPRRPRTPDNGRCSRIRLVRTNFPTPGGRLSPNSLKRSNPMSESVGTFSCPDIFGQMAQNPDPAAPTIVRGPVVLRPRPAPRPRPPRLRNDPNDTPEPLTTHSSPSFLLLFTISFRTICCIL